MMKKVKLLFVAIVIIAGYTLTAQVAVNSDGSNADSSAMLDVKSSSKGILIPRITQADIEAINNPANGLMVFNNDVGKLYIYISSEFKWKEVQYGSGEILYPASITIGTGGACANTTVNGDYIRCVGLTTANTLVIDATVISAGAWSIATDTVNGYSFSGNGTAITTGTVQLTLMGYGTPDDNQTDTFTATVNLGGTSSCTFQVVVTIPLCDDSNICTVDSYNAAICSCEYTPVDCDDGDPCTNDYCDPVTGCTHTLVDCDDGNICTNDYCDPGVGCTHTAVDCDDGDPNTLDLCDPAIGCVHTLIPLNQKPKQEKKNN